MPVYPYLGPFLFHYASSEFCGWSCLVSSNFITPNPKGAFQAVLTFTISFENLNYQVPMNGSFTIITITDFIPGQCPMHFIDKSYKTKVVEN